MQNKKTPCVCGGGGEVAKIYKEELAYSSRGKLQADSLQRNL